MIPACDQRHCTPPTTTACAVMMRSGYNNGGLLGVSTCSVFVINSLILLEYTDCFLWYLVFVSNFGMCYVCTVSSSERIVIRTVAFVSAIYRCIVSALVMMHAWCRNNTSNPCWQTSSLQLDTTRLRVWQSQCVYGTSVMLTDYKFAVRYHQTMGLLVMMYVWHICHVDRL